MKQIIVISDTHLPKRKRDLPEQLISKMKQSDYLIHAGDFSNLDIYQYLKNLTKVIGVYGNVDDKSLREKLPLKQVVKIEEVTIGITHGHGRSMSTKKRVLDLFQAEKLDLIIFGHTHIPILEKSEAVTLFNPGSPTDKRNEPYYSYGVLDIDKNCFKISHIVY